MVDVSEMRTELERNQKMSKNESGELEAKTGQQIAVGIGEFYRGLGLTRLDEKLPVSVEELDRQRTEKWVTLEFHEKEIQKLQAEVERLLRERTALVRRLNEAHAQLDTVRDLAQAEELQDFLRLLRGTDKLMIGFPDKKVVDPLGYDEKLNYDAKTISLKAYVTEFLESCSKIEEWFARLDKLVKE